MEVLKKIRSEIFFIYVELKKTFSNEPSYFSSKRIERAMLFLTAIISSNAWFWYNFKTLEREDIAAYIILHLGFAGYTMRQTQKEKKLNSKLKEEKEDE